MRTPSRRIARKAPSQSPAEVDVVVLGAGGELAAHPDVPDEGGRRVVAVPGHERHRGARQEVPVDEGEVGVGDHRVGLDDLTVLESHAPHLTRRALGEEDAVDAGPVAERRPCLLGGRRQGDREGVHAADGDEDAVDGVHVGDDGVDGEGFVGGQAGVHGLEGEDPLEPLVVEVLADDLGQLPEPPEAEEVDGGPQRGRQVERRVEAALDEGRHLQLVEPLEPVAEAAEGVGLVGRRRPCGSPRSWRRDRGGPAARSRRHSTPGTSGRRDAAPGARIDRPRRRRSTDR